MTAVSSEMASTTGGQVAAVSPEEAVASFTGAPVAPREVQWEIEQLLFHEARLFDERRYREWMDILAEDLHYWMPVRFNTTRREQNRETSGPHEIANFDDNKEGIEWRLKRIETGLAWTEDPPSRTRHLVSNVWVRPTDVAGEYDVQSCFVLYRNRDDVQLDIMAGKRDDVWRSTGPGRWQLVRRRILLDQNVLLAGNLSFFF